MKLKAYLTHLPTCNLRQDWFEADDAMASTPIKFRDARYYEAQEELNRKKSTCTCGLDTMIKSIEAEGSPKDEFLKVMILYEKGDIDEAWATYMIHSILTPAVTDEGEKKNPIDSLDSTYNHSWGSWMVRKESALDICLDYILSIDQLRYDLAQATAEVERLKYRPEIDEIGGLEETISGKS